MAASRLVIFSVFLALVFTQIRADVSTEPLLESDASGFSALKAELDQLKSKISLLESNLEEKIGELKAKDEKIKEKDEIILVKSDNVASLQTELSSLQKKGTSDTKDRVGKAHAQALELQKQADKLKSELEAKLKEKNSLEARATKAENKLDELNLKLENLQKVNKEQVNKIAKTERALKIAEEELIKTKFEATSKANELLQVHTAWFPPWLAKQLNRGQAFIQTHWSERGKPTLDLVMQKALEKKALAKKWADPHMETIKTKWVPAIKGQWVVVTTHAKPHVQSLKAKTVEVYEASKTAVTPHIDKAHEIVDPYFQEAKKFSKPCIDHVATLAKPHVDKVCVVMKPYTKEIVNAYGRFLESATTYHQQVQASVQETLKKHELTRPFATKELEWFAASALLALPIIILFRIFSAIFRKKEKKRARHANTTNGRRRGKRGHTDK
ncbi:hypothetical protein F3Y22_tig00110557pilonHSYRG00147 [Hibiscus syriacus]|uniref:Uncharacterized protein n=1 Tax=Hibiscus syriacus TaxID=106335 RepID=A0A6A3A7C1_HIBSY|nr:uncharacterized protein LOC120131923 [Hibiscus syriacus]XP_039004713.1 uncharacterized protein LOC120131923 [Hibiscus syriacus]KAE8700280.1 hypothetical protein F3Y22_tig00110557pilonHSYRG00147 [Hibiscus syriacus]